MSTEQQIASFRQAFTALRDEIGKVIVGHLEIVDGTLIAIFAGGHVLLEGVPGLGKTLLVRTLAAFRRRLARRLKREPTR
jgi:MoxR-like ATPase